MWGNLRAKFSLSTICYPQIDGQTKLVNKYFTQLLRVSFKKILKIRKIVCHLLNLHIIIVCILPLIIHYLRLFIILII
jgi:hypothetical protein